MTPEKSRLIRELLDEQREARRSATLLASGRILRRRRWRRLTFRSLAALTLLGLATVTLQHLTSPRPPVTAPIASGPPAEIPVQVLTDAQLLELFPDTPVGLVTLADGTKRLIFPRPGDEERFTKGL